MSAEVPKDWQNRKKVPYGFTAEGTGVDEHKKSIMKHSSVIGWGIIASFQRRSQYTSGRKDMLLAVISVNAVCSLVA